MNGCLQCELELVWMQDFVVNLDATCMQTADMVNLNEYSLT